MKPAVYGDALNAAIKSFYFQRSSMPISEACGGKYKRATGHPDTKAIFHPLGKNDWYFEFSRRLV
ncbi:MAG: hypothetical protein U5K51_15525 [Flavobacteriaceae bacterium]|nr:hypothetical protein [Flavobacteriaceae bacterium]